MTQKVAKSDLPIIVQIFNALFVIITMILGVMAFLSLLNLVLAISTSLIITSVEYTVQQKYTISTIRNLYLLFGGCFMLGFLIVSMDYHMKRLNNRKTTRILAWTLAIELIILGLSLII